MDPFDHHPTWAVDQTDQAAAQKLSSRVTGGWQTTLAPTGSHMFVGNMYIAPKLPSPLPASYGLGFFMV